MESKRYGGQSRKKHRYPPEKELRLRVGCLTVLYSQQVEGMKFSKKHKFFNEVSEFAFKISYNKTSSHVDDDMTVFSRKCYLN